MNTASSSIATGGKAVYGAAVGILMLECTNMIPYAADIQRVSGVPVYSIYTFINWFQGALCPRQNW